GAQVNAAPQPGKARRALVAKWSGAAGDTRIGRQPPVTPVASNGLRQLRVQLKAAARQALERRPITPIQREKATGLAGGGTGDAGALDDDGLDAATAQEIGGGGTDDTATTDDNPHARLQAAATPDAPRCASRQILRQ